MSLSMRLVGLFFGMLLLAAAATVGYDAGLEDGADRVYTTEDANVTGLEVKPDYVSVENYSGFHVSVDLETDGSADAFYVPTIYVIRPLEGSVIEQHPAKTFDPNTTGTYSMGFFAIEPLDVDEPLRLIVHVEDHAEVIVIYE